MRSFLGASAHAFGAVVLAIACSSGDDGKNNNDIVGDGSVPNNPNNPNNPSNPAMPGCGNSVVEGVEQCDGANLRGATCASATMGALQSGGIRCSPSCTFDTSQCVPVAGGSGGSANPGNGGSGNPNPGSGGMGPGGSFGNGGTLGDGGSNPGSGGTLGDGGSFGNGGTLGDGGSSAGNGESGRMVGFTDAHNRIRSEVPTPSPLPPLTWSPQIAAVAQAYADQLATQGCPLVHSNTPGYGENLAWFSGQPGSATQVVDMWASELACYTYGTIRGTEQCDAFCTTRYGGCGHYTQLVWRGTTQVGCGMATCPGEEIWVCNYAPPGNYIGQAPY